MKIWKDEDNKGRYRPSSVTVKLLADGEETGQTATVSETNGWTYEFTGLDRYQEGKEIAYTVESECSGWLYSFSEGYNITNTHTPEKTNTWQTK